MQRYNLLLTGIFLSVSLLPAIAAAQVADDDTLLGTPRSTAGVPASGESPVLAPRDGAEPATPTLPLDANGLPVLPELPALADDPSVNQPPANPPATAGDNSATPLPNNPSADDDAQADAAYEMIFKKLSDKHQAQMKALDESFVKTLRPTLQVFRMGAELEFCLQPPRALAGQDKKYIDAFKAFRDQRDDEQDALWAAHRKETLVVTYLDHELLDAHYRNQAAVAMETGKAMIQDAEAKGLLKNTDCASVQKTLDAAAAKASAITKPALNSPKSPAKTAPQGTQNPSR